MPVVFPAGESSTFLEALIPEEGEDHDHRCLDGAGSESEDDSLFLVVGISRGERKEKTERM